MTFALLGACAGNISADRQLGDAVLSANILDVFEADRELSRYDLVVDANGSVVTLLGEVATNTLRTRAEQLAASVDGVTRVVNEIRVRN